jgi:hypothetical protein
MQGAYHTAADLPEGSNGQTGTSADKEYYPPSVYRNPPRGDFDPLQASDADLETYCLPARPDGAAAPVALSNWKRAMSRPFFFTPGGIAELTMPAQAGDQAGRASGGGPAQEASRNWSGAYIRPRDGRQLVLVEAMWIVPKPYPPVSWRQGNGSTRATFGSSTWVGLDGHDPRSMSLPQIGTAQFVTADASGQTPSVFAWWQWWVRGEPNNAPMMIGEFPVASGDLVHCRVTARSSERVNLFIKNQSSGAVVSFDVEAPKPKQGKPTDRDIIVEGRTAEWVLERPTKPGSKELLTLPDYGATIFYACNAAARTGDIWEEQQLERARLIKLKDWDRPNNGATVSTPVRLSESSLLLCYQGNVP